MRIEAKGGECVVEVRALLHAAQRAAQHLAPDDDHRLGLGEDGQRILVRGQIAEEFGVGDADEIGAEAARGFLDGLGCHAHDPFLSSGATLTRPSMSRDQVERLRNGASKRLPMRPSSATRQARPQAEARRSLLS